MKGNLNEQRTDRTDSAGSSTRRTQMKVGGKYNWKGQKERLVYLGYQWSGNGYWHQFEKVGEPGKVWCKVLDSDLTMIEKTEGECK